MISSIHIGDRGHVHPGSNNNHPCAPSALNYIVVIAVHPLTVRLLWQKNLLGALYQYRCSLVYANNLRVPALPWAMNGRVYGSDRGEPYSGIGAVRVFILPLLALSSSFLPSFTLCSLTLSSCSFPSAIYTGSHDFTNALHFLCN